MSLNSTVSCSLLHSKNFKISKKYQYSNRIIRQSYYCNAVTQNLLHDLDIEKLFNKSCRLYLITEKKHTFNYRLMRKQTLVIAATTPCIIPSQFLVWKCIFVLIRAMAGLHICCNQTLWTSWNKLFKNIFCCFNESNINF